MSAASADLTALARDLAASSEAMPRVAAQVVRTTAMEVAAEAKTRAPVRTGALKMSIQVHFSGPLQATIGPGVIYGVFQEFGTGSKGEFPSGSYVIRPKRPGGRLVFKVDGKTVSAREVRHPGVRPHPYMRPGLTAALGRMAPALEKAGALLITKGPGAA